MTNDEIYKSIRDEFNTRAAELAADGRAKRLWQHQESPTRDQHTDDLIRWAFWKQTQRNDTQAARDSTDDAYLREILLMCIEKARSDEQERFGKAIAAAIQRFSGGALNGGITHAVIDALGFGGE